MATMVDRFITGLDEEASPRFPLDLATGAATPGGLPASGCASIPCRWLEDDDAAKTAA